MHGYREPQAVPQMLHAPLPRTRTLLKGPSTGLFPIPSPTTAAGWPAPSPPGAFCAHRERRPRHPWSVGVAPTFSRVGPDSGCAAVASLGSRAARGGPNPPPGSQHGSRQPPGSTRFFAGRSEAFQFIRPRASADGCAASGPIRSRSDDEPGRWDSGAIRGLGSLPRQGLHGKDIHCPPTASCSCAPAAARWPPPKDKQPTGGTGRG